MAAIDLDDDVLAGVLDEVEAGDRGFSVACDITDPASVKSAVAATVARFGQIDILCNIAGGSSAQDARVTEAPDEESWRVIKLGSLRDVPVLQIRRTGDDQGSPRLR